MRGAREAADLDLNVTGTKSVLIPLPVRTRSSYQIRDDAEVRCNSVAKCFVMSPYQVPAAAPMISERLSQPQEKDVTMATQMRSSQSPCGCAVGVGFDRDEVHWAAVLESS